MAALLGSVFYIVSGHVNAQPLALVIDDLGNSRTDAQAVELPGAVTLAFLPQTPYARELALHGYARGKEIMLHLPMEAESGNRLGPGGVDSSMQRDEFQQQIEHSLSALPFVSGVNNHMGSKLTRLVEPMHWTMQVLKRHPLYFLDSRTTTQTQAEKIARLYGVPTTRRHVFLDTYQDEQWVKQQLAVWIRLAREGKAPIAIGHPYPATMQQLQRLLPALNASGLELVPVSALLSQPLPASTVVALPSKTPSQL